MDPAPAPRAADTPSLRRRLACWVYEGVLLFGVLFAAQGAASLLDVALHRLGSTGPTLSRGAGQAVLLFVVLGAYFTWQWTRSGQTLPMRTWQLRVVNAADASLLSWPRAAWRYILCWVWVLPPLALADALSLGAAQTAALVTAWATVWALLARFRADTQFWHDVWAGTRLVRAPPPTAKT